ncbi:MAG: glycosyltransferase family 39 protein [Candidatus Omnitrophica bacterium]|nr:glycosyltransferase family 39 protein [Candidatus Omnitrophota bacterium]
MDERKYTRYAFLTFGIFFLIRLFIASFYGLTGDEAHYYQYALHPSLSYFDHPPFVGYAILFFLKIFGNTPLAVRFPAIISSSVCIWLLFLTGRNFHSAYCGFWAVVVFCLIPLFSVLGGIMTVPDTILSVFWLLSIITLWKIHKTGNPWLWYLLGFLAGLSLLTKYSGFLLYPAILLFMISDREMRQYFKKKQVYSGFVISLIVFSPVLIWNYNNHWASFVFQFKHGLGEKSFFNSEIFFQNISAQMAVISPFIWLMMIAVFFKAIRQIFQSADIFNKLFLSFSIPVFAVFGYASLSNEILPHWPAPGYLTLIPFCAVFLANTFNGLSQFRKFLARIILFTGAIFTFAIPVHIVFRCLPLPSEIDPTGDIYGWDKAACVAESLRIESGSETVLLTHKFYLASHMAFHLKSEVARNYLYCLSKRVDQYDFWQRDKNLREVLNGRTVIFFTDEHFKDSPEKLYSFKSLDKRVMVEVFYKKKKVKTFYFYVCRGFATYDTDPSYFNSSHLTERNLFRNFIATDDRNFLSVNRFASENRTLANFLFAIGYLGSTEVAVLIVTLILYFSRRDDFMKYFWIYFFIMLLGGIIVNLSKESFDSFRPPSYFNNIKVYVTGPVLKSGSFPSGHAQTAFASAVFLSWIFRRMTLVFIFLATTVAFSRVFSGIHFFRDIITGALIGIVSFWIVVCFYRLFLKMTGKIRNLTGKKKGVK